MMSQLKSYGLILLIGFGLGLFVGGSAACKKETVKKEAVESNVTAAKAIVKPNGEIVFDRPVFHRQEFSLDKTISPVTSNGFWVGGFYDPLTGNKKGALAYQLGPLFPCVSTDLTSIELGLFVHF